MTTPTISTALPSASNNAASLRTGDSREPDAATPTFSAVLTRQQTSGPAPVKARPADTDSTSHKGATPDVAADDTKPTDDAPAELAAEQGLGLPQIALNIAAEAALAIAARQPGAVRPTPAAITATLSTSTQPNAPSTDTAALAADLARGKLPSTSASTAQAGLDAATALAGTAKHDATPLKPLPGIKLDTPAVTTAKAIATPAGFIPVQTTTPLPSVLDLHKALPHQTELDLRKSPTAAAITRKAALPTQAWTADPTIAKTAALDATALAADIASVSARASFAGASTHIDLSASQAGAISAASGNAAGITASPGNVGFMPNTVAQTALPGIATPLQSPQWSADFGRQFVSLTQGGHTMPHTAELRLDPPELGPLRISINISDNVAHAIFTSPHAAVRQTVENALPQLQQLLAQAGISLGQTSVNDQGQADQSFNESFGASRKTTTVDASGTVGDVAGLDPRSPARSRAPDALVDTFA